MDGLSTLDFDKECRYEESPTRILLPVRLIDGDHSVELRARLDTGAADCIFDSSYAEVLGLRGAGIERQYRTVTGSFKAVGHEVMMETLGHRWPALVFFCQMGNPSSAFLGRRGWLDHVRLGVVHYEQRLFLGQYSR